MIGTGKCKLASRQPSNAKQPSKNMLYMAACNTWQGVRSVWLPRASLAWPANAMVRAMRAQKTRARAAGGCSHYLPPQ